MYVIRLARTIMGREKIIKGEGEYHGTCAEAQMPLWPSRSVNCPQAVPDSAGIPKAVAEDVLVAPFNDIDYMRSLLDEYDGQVAAIMVEPLQRVVPPLPGYLQALRDECDKRGILLIFDEIVTGFRFSYGGAQELYGVTPDIATLGKIIGGGFPLAAIVGRAEIMAHFDKSKVGEEGWLMQLGTLSGNPIAAAAGLKTMEVLARDGAFEQLRDTGRKLQEMQSDALTEAGIAHRVVGDPTLFDIVFLDRDVVNYRDTQAADAAMNAHYNKVLREEGVFKSPGKLYPSLAVTDLDLELTEAAVKKAVAAIG